MAVPAPLHRVEAIDSTMDALHAMAAEGAPDGTAMAADVLTQARGARGRPWHAPRGGLWLSVLRRPSVAPPASVLSLRVGLAVAERLDAQAPRRVELKWPNDLILGGRKLGGILCELRWQGSAPSWVVIGVGLNVENEVPDPVRDSATSLVDHAPGVTVAEVRDVVVAAVRGLAIDRERLNEEELHAFSGRDWLAGRGVVEPVAGTCRGITADGALVVAGADGGVRLLRTSEGLALVPDAPGMTPHHRPA